MKPNEFTTRRAVRGRRSILPYAYITYSVPQHSWLLLNDYPYHVDQSYVLTIPKGFAFDLSSIPRAVWPVLAPFELSIVAPLVHDFLYGRSGKLPDRTFSRLEVDTLFYNIMLTEGVAKWRAGAAFRAVRIFARRF
jgi:hypothetical protein